MLTKLFLAIVLSAALVGAESPTTTEVELAPGTLWKRHTIDDTSRGADGVKLGDINGDGLQDVATGWEQGGEVRVYLNPGPAKSRDAWPRVTVGNVGNVEEAIFADLDGDGRLEVVSGTEGKTRTLYWHRFAGSPDELLSPERWSTSAFPATENAQMWMQAAAVQIDGQHGGDLLLASKGTGAAVGWLQAPPAHRALADWRFHKLRDAGWVMTLTPHDVDGDGDSDAAFTDRKGARSGVFWLENPGAAANATNAPWKEHAIGALGREVMFADIGDVNGDGLADVAAATKPASIFLFLRRAGGAWEERVIQLDGTNIGDAKAVKIADVNLDGLPDLLFTCENAKGKLEGIVWLEQRAGAPWRQRTLGGPDGLKYDLMQTLDLDGDGDLDVITCEERDGLGVIWYENPHLPRR
ncbi:MAG: VCBS repeat-containing protein [Chthoniobacteraceae bacterium]